MENVEELSKKISEHFGIGKIHVYGPDNQHVE
ncbi:hypothetical protein LCGC14_2766730, partial [marine sediment metagenome]